MDGKRFDELTRVMGAGTSRRSVIKGLAAAAGGGLVALVGRRAPSAFASGGEDWCNSSTHLCDPGDYCVPNSRSPWYASDPAAGICEMCNTLVDPSFVCTGAHDGWTCVVEPGDKGRCVSPLCADGHCGENQRCDNYTGECSCIFYYICGEGCCEVNEECVDDETCVPVGGLGEPCAGGEFCNDGLNCVSGTCKASGALNDPCSDRDPCGSGLLCIAGHCQQCNTSPGYDVPCPADQYCDVTGNAGICKDCDCKDTETCGPTLDVGVPACTCTADLCGGVCCDTGTHCVDGACKGPSALGGACSATDRCAAGLFCIPNAANPANGADASAGYCEECHPGVAGAVCGGGDYCDASGQFGVCKACACGGNEICDPVGGACSCPNVTCGDACCAAGMVCSGGACVECAGNSDCMSGEICQNNVCVGVQCTSDAMCNVAAGQHCDETTHACTCVNETCGAGTAKVCCAAGEVCDATGGCAVACTQDSNCAKGEHCDTKAGYCVANECAKDADCPGSKVCHKGWCVAECAKDADCAKGDVCKDGTCTAGEGQSGGGEEGKGENGGGTSGGATQLPNTGVGRGASGGSSWLGAAVIGGAAALLAGKKLRQDAAPTDVE